MMRQVRAITTSKNPVFRFFLLGFGLLLINVWVRLRWLYARKYGPGPKRVDPVLFCFKSFAYFLRCTIEHIYGVAIPTHLSSEFVIY